MHRIYSIFLISLLLLNHSYGLYINDILNKEITVKESSQLKGTATIAEIGKTLDFEHNSQKFTHFWLTKLKNQCLKLNEKRSITLKRLLNVLAGNGKIVSLEGNTFSIIPASLDHGRSYFFVSSLLKSKRPLVGLTKHNSFEIHDSGNHDMPTFKKWLAEHGCYIDIYSDLLVQTPQNDALVFRTGYLPEKETGIVKVLLRLVDREISISELTNSFSDLWAKIDLNKPTLDGYDTPLYSPRFTSDLYYALSGRHKIKLGKFNVVKKGECSCRDNALMNMVGPFAMLDVTLVDCLKTVEKNFTQLNGKKIQLILNSNQQNNETFSLSCGKIHLANFLELLKEALNLEATVHNNKIYCTPYKYMNFKEKYVNHKLNSREVTGDIPAVYLPNESPIDKQSLLFVQSEENPTKSATNEKERKTEEHLSLEKGAETNPAKDDSEKDGLEYADEGEELEEDFEDEKFENLDVDEEFEDQLEANRAAEEKRREARLKGNYTTNMIDRKYFGEIPAKSKEFSLIPLNSTANRFLIDASKKSSLKNWLTVLGIKIEGQEFIHCQNCGQLLIKGTIPKGLREVITLLNRGVKLTVK